MRVVERLIYQHESTYRDKLIVGLDPVPGLQEGIQRSVAERRTFFFNEAAGRRFPQSDSLLRSIAGPFRREGARVWYNVGMRAKIVRSIFLAAIAAAALHL